jgi:flagellar biosynthesis anti-sigma factor FlgM
MKVNDPNLSSLAATGATGIQNTPRTPAGGKNGDNHAGAAVSSDGVHLSELVRSLRALASESPERQARMEEIARSVATGTYQVDAPATASKIVDDGLRRS